MRAHVFIGLLLTCLVIAEPVADNDNSTDYYTVSTFDAQLFSHGIWVYDDEGNPVQVTPERDAEDEPDEVTRKDLWNRVFFYLYTAENPVVAQPLYINDHVALAKSNFNPKRATRIVTHGWVNSNRSPACTLIRDAYIKHGDYNVIVVDWSKISFRPYLWASSKVKIVGQFVSSMINFLEKHGMNLNTTTMVGHSLGAHVMGLAGHYAKGKINYIVGLDPALPNFILAGPGSRIASGDANYVEIIHTNAGLLGYLTAIGDSDFYPNGGSRQLGCILDVGGACSHARSYQFYAESINTPVGFYGKNCKSYLSYKLGLCKRKHTSLMGGIKKLFSARGSYFLNTKSSFPFAKGHR